MSFYIIATKTNTQWMKNELEKAFVRRQPPPDARKGAITSKTKEIKLKTSPARLAQLLQPSLAFCLVLQDLFYVLLHVLFYL